MRSDKGVGEGKGVSEMTQEGIDEGCQEGVLGEVWFKVPGEDASEGRKGVKTGAKEVKGEVAGNLRWVAECMTEAVAKIQDVSLRPLVGEICSSNVVE